MNDLLAQLTSSQNACNHEKSSVDNSYISRYHNQSGIRYRRRICNNPSCGKKFTTLEIVVEDRARWASNQSEKIYYEIKLIGQLLGQLSAKGIQLLRMQGEAALKFDKCKMGTHNSPRKRR